MAALYRNVGNGRFADVTASVGLRGAHDCYGGLRCRLDDDGAEDV